MQGQTEKAQKIVVRAKGWDPDVIEGHEGEDTLRGGHAIPITSVKPSVTSGSIGHFETPIPDQQRDFPEAMADGIPNGAAWNAPDTDKEKDHHTNGASPWMGGRFGG
jgi:hypothetical protein